ncbi:MAG: hypothetical protein ABIO43_02390 [Sphingomicrobium sp.]
MTVNRETARAPAWFWIVAVLATLWNAFGGYDYWMTRTRNMDHLSQMPGIKAEDILAYIDSYPLYAQIGWGLGVWGGLAGSVLLLMRSRYAVHAFAVSLLGMALSFGYQYFGGSKMPAGMDEGAHKYMPLVIIAIGLGLLWFARSMRGKAVLR